MKRRKDLVKYKVLGERLWNFFVMVRDARGAVSRALLEEYMVTLPEAGKKTYLSFLSVDGMNFGQGGGSSTGLHTGV